MYSLLLRLPLLSVLFTAGVVMLTSRSSGGRKMSDTPSDTEIMLRLVVQNIPQSAVIVVDREMRYVLAEGEELIANGYHPPDMIGKTIYEVLPGESVTPIEEGYRRAFRGETHIFERTMSGRYYVSRFSPVRNVAGEIEYGLAIVQNLTELTEVRRARNELQAANERLNHSLEELRLANQEIQRFTHIVSHDLRAPLISLTGFGQLLREAFDHIVQVIDHPQDGLRTEIRQTIAEEIADTIPASLQFISAATHRLDTLTQAVLKLARYGRLELRLERIDVYALIEGIIGSMAGQIHERGVTVTIHPMTSLVADRVALTIIFGNLLDNAAKYLDPARPGQSSIESGVTFHVTDNGRGIAAGDHRQVFEPFQRGDMPDTDGEGMGLAYVHTLVRRLGGQITFESQPGVGTTFSVRLPHRVIPAASPEDSYPTGAVLI
jgi:PAS domain S-box-containing protein